MSSASEIAKLQKHYEDKGEDLNKFSKDSKVYNLSLLYKNIAKNYGSAKKYGASAVPAMSYNVENGQHKFENSPEFSKHFNDNLPDLLNLARYDMEFPADEQGTKTTTPCLSLNKKEPRITAQNLDSCNNINCYRCNECQPHQEELIKSLQGLTQPSSMVSDVMRGVHAKNLVSALHSWASHQDTRGYDAESCTDRSYDNDANNHSSLSNAMRGIADKLNVALEYDNERHGGGAKHRDYMGNNYGKNKDVY